VYDGLAKLFLDTPFSAGIVEIPANIDIAYTEGILNLRNTLMNYIVDVGDEIEYAEYKINITFNPLSINVDARIVGLSYTPYDMHNIQIEVAGYVPNLLETSAKKNDANIRKIYQEFQAADSEMLSKI
jgi:hypothetical protein